MSRNDLATAFHRLHQPRGGAILVLPNAWDAMSARAIEKAGASAIATTSAGVSWSLGRPDGEGLSRNDMIEVVRRIVDSVSIPVTADIERGYGTGRPADVEDSVRRVIAVGAVGINLEDGAGSKEPRLLDTSRQVDRIGAARAAAQSEGVKLFINARVDVYLRQFGKEAGRLEESLRRAEAYVGAEADGIFIPGVIDPETIRQLAGGIRAPLNIMAGPGAPAVAELAQLGVARVSIGPSLTLSVMAHIQRAATELVRRGTYDTIEGGSPFAEVNALFSRAG